MKGVYAAKCLDIAITKTLGGSGLKHSDLWNPASHNKSWENNNFPG